jgi:uncharacterized membrane protein
MSFRETPFNRECVHHHLVILQAETCPYCGEPSLEELGRRYRRRFFWVALVAILSWLTWLSVK